MQGAAKAHLAHRQRRGTRRPLPQHPDAMPEPRLLRTVADLLMPRTCPGCGAVLAYGERDVCCLCLADLPLLTPGLWATDRRWGLFRELPHVRSIGALVRYHPGNVASRLVHSLKYHGRWQVGVVMGCLMSRLLGGKGLLEGADVVLPVPITWRRRWQRGFNQSEFIARGLCQTTGIAMRTDLLLRTRHTESQTHFPYAERAGRVEGSFSLAPGAALQLRGRTVVVLDDVMTSGSTMRAAAMALAAAECAAVRCVAWSWAG